MFQDVYLTCQDCGNRFLFSADEQEYFAEHNLTTPKHCPTCREKRANGSQWNGGCLLDILLLGAFFFVVTISAVVGVFVAPAVAIVCVIELVLYYAWYGKKIRIVTDTINRNRLVFYILSACALLFWYFYYPYFRHFSITKTMTWQYVVFGCIASIAFCVGIFFMIQVYREEYANVKSKNHEEHGTVGSIQLNQTSRHS